MTASPSLVSLGDLLDLSLRRHPRSRDMIEDPRCSPVPVRLFASFAVVGLVTHSGCSPSAMESAPPNATADGAAHDAAPDDDPAARPDVGPDGAAPSDAASEIRQDAAPEAGLLAFGLDERP